MGSFSIRSNIASIRAQRRLSDTSDALATTYQRLASGQRINRASDDAAGLAIANSLSVDKRVFTQGVRNLNDGISLLSIADQTLSKLSEIVTRQRELAEQAANGVYTTEQRTALNNEAQALNKEYNRIVESTSFNGMQLLAGEQGRFVFQAGYNTEGTVAADVRTETDVITGYTDLGTTTNSTKNFSDIAYGTILDKSVLVGDLNNDGIDDIAAFRVAQRTASSANITLRVYLGSSDGNYTQAADTFKTVTVLNPTSANIKARLNDYDSDGDLDIQLTADVNGGTSVTENETFDNLTIQNGGTFGLDQAFNDNVGSPVDQSNHFGANGIGDFNGDSIADDLTINGGNTFTIKTHDSSPITERQVESLLQSSFSISNQGSALSALDSLDTQLSQLAEKRGRVGASTSRITVAANVLQAASENSAAAAARIMDADIALESARLTKQKILQNTVSAILAQANQQPELALSLLTQGRK